MPRAGIRVEDQAHRVLAAADAERMDFQARARGRQARADLEHVGAEDDFLPGDQVVGVVLHQRGAAGQPRAHDLRGAHEHRRLPVALGAEPVAVGHQALHGESRQLAQGAQVLEARGERAEAARLEEGPQPEFDARAVAQRVVPLGAAAQFRRDVVALLVFLDQGVHVLLARGIHRVGEVVHAPGVDLHAELQFGFGLVALGDGDEAHVVAEPRELQVVGGRPAGGRARPGADLRRDRRVRGVADHGLARDPEPGLDVAELPVAVGRLVEVHEVHVEVRPRQFDVGLRVQVEQRLAQQVEAR